MKRSRSGTGRSRSKEEASVGKKRRRLAIDMRGDLSHRTRSKHCEKSHFEDAANLLDQAGFFSWGGFLSSMTRQAIPKCGFTPKQKCAASQFCLIGDISAHYENEANQSSGREGCSKREKFDDVVIPHRLNRWAADLSPLGGFFPARS